MAEANPDWYFTFLAAGAAASAFIWSEQKKQNSLQVTAGNAHDVGSDYRNILYKGEKISV